MTNISSIIESFGRQFWVEPKKFQDVSNFKVRPKLSNSNLKSFRVTYSNKPEKANIVFFDRIMLFINQDNIQFGQPFLKDFRVEGNIVPGLKKKSKFLVFKMHAKKRFRRRIGFKLTSRRIRFDNILQIHSLETRSDLQVLVPVKDLTSL